MDAWADIRRKARACHEKALATSKGDRSAAAIIVAALKNDALEPRPYAFAPGTLGSLDRSARLVNVAKGLDPVQERVVIAHEIGHFHLHRDPHNEVTARKPALGGDPVDSGAGRVEGYTPESCLEIDVKSVVFGGQAPGLNDTAIAKAVDERHQRWSEQLPRESAELWDALIAFDPDSRDALFAHCVALSVNAVFEPWNRRSHALAHADRIAEAVSLDIVAAGWSPTVDNYFGRVTKARIVEAVREAKGETAAQLIEHLKKSEMAERAHELLAGSGWLPEPLRTLGRATGAPSPASEVSEGSSDGPVGKESAVVGYETAIGDSEVAAEDVSVPAEQPLVAAE